MEQSALRKMAIGDSPSAGSPTSRPPGPSDRGDLARALDVELSGSLNVRRTALQVLDLLASRFADWAMLVVADPRSNALHLYGGDDAGFTASVRAREGAEVLHQVMESGHHDLLHVDLSSHAHDALSSVIPHPGLRDQAASLHPVDVLATPMWARGNVVGAMVAVRQAGHGFDRDEAALIQQLGDRAALALDSARIYEDHARVTRVLEESLRPPELPHIADLEVSASFRAAAAHLEIGGDFYDLHRGEDDWLAVLGDVCGKGVDAAVLNGRARQSIRTAARFDRRPSRILSTLNDVLYEDSSDRFVTVVCCRFRPVEAGRYVVDMAVAGHPAPFVVRQDGAVEQPEVSGRLAGALPNVDGYQEVTVELGPRDALVLYSDGIYEAHGDDGLYGLDRLRALLSRYAGSGARAMCEAVERDVVEHLGGHGHDDMTALVLSPRTGTR